MYNIYYNSLPIYNLNKRDGYDVEVIKRRNDNTIDCHYFLPIYCDDMEFYNEMQVYHNNIVKPEMSVTLGLPRVNYFGFHSVEATEPIYVRPNILISHYSSVESPV